jgi:tetratricopeptide (TPR) repeat protein
MIVDRLLPYSLLRSARCRADDRGSAAHRDQERNQTQAETTSLVSYYSSDHTGKSPGLGVVAVLLACVAGVYGQGAAKPHSAAASSLQDHYNAAETLQGIGELAQAATQYKLFLAEALHQVANGRAQVGRYPEAVPLFDEALALTPNDAALEMDYTEAALDAHDLPNAQHLAQNLIDTSSRGVRDRRSAKLHWLLGQALLGMDNNKGATDQFAAAVAIDPTFENQYALSQADLSMLDKKDAAKIFAKMLAEFGDSAQIHMEFGLAYGNADFPEEAIPEFRKALARNDKLLDAHYSLGASYLRRSGDSAFPQAEAEFRKELSIHPNDFLSYYELGYIAMKEQRTTEAVRDLTRAAALNPHSDDTFLLLGDLYSQLGRPTEQEDALRKAIQACTDPSRNHYQIREAHYQLGLLLIQQGKADEGKKEMQIAQDLLLENRKLDVANLEGKPILRYPERKADRITDRAAATEVEQFEQRVGPAIADSFNNLGVIDAEKEDYNSASGYFHQAAEWNPTMEGLDYNWGRAAFGARDYRQAALCLSRYMRSHPDDARPRVPLGMSQFMMSEYKDAIDTLAPLQPQMDAVPLLAYAYADSLIKAGDTAEGIDRLQHLEAAHPDFNLAPAALGYAFAAQHEYAKAEIQLRSALRINPADREAKYNLALVLIALSRRSEAEALLTELEQSDGKNPAVYYQLGKLQLDAGKTNAALSSLEAAARLAPNDDVIRLELAEAHSRRSTAGGKNPTNAAPITQQNRDGSH